MSSNADADTAAVIAFYTNSCVAFPLLVRTMDI